MIMNLVDKIGDEARNLYTNVLDDDQRDFVQEASHCEAYELLHQAANAMTPEAGQRMKPLVAIFAALHETQDDIEAALARVLERNIFKVYRDEAPHCLNTQTATNQRESKNTEAPPTPAETKTTIADPDSDLFE